MSANVSYSQTSNNSTNDKAKLVTLCEKAKNEVVILRGVWNAASHALKLATEALADERERGNLTQEQLVIREKEILALRDALQKAKDAFDLKEKEVNELNRQIGSLRKRKNFFKSVAKYATVATVVLGAVVFIQNK